jgi:ParB-like chromosome segregation protein Spo0J
MKEYEFHPIADLFPLMSGDELAELARDIKANGLDQAGLLFEDKILDGRNRYLACQQAGVEFEAAIYDGDEPVAKVVTLNLHRRHLSTSQRAAIANDMARLQKGRQEQIGSTTYLAQPDAAKMLDVSSESVKRVRRVEREAPELIEPIRQGKMTVNKAWRQVRNDQSSMSDVQKPINKPPQPIAGVFKLPEVKRPDGYLILSHYLLDIILGDEILSGEETIKTLGDKIKLTWNSLFVDAWDKALVERGNRKAS